MSAQRILVVSGSRCFRDHPSAEQWAHERMVKLFADFAPTLAVHGDAIGWDTFCEARAVALGVPRVVFPMKRTHPVVRGVDRHGHRVERPAQDHALYQYSEPIARNAVMMRWAANRMDEGHRVEVVIARAPWSRTGGTLTALGFARELDLPVVELDVPTLDALEGR